MHPFTSDTTTCEEDNSTMVTDRNYFNIITLHAELDDYLETPCVLKKPTYPVNILEG